MRRAAAAGLLMCVCGVDLPAAEVQLTSKTVVRFATAEEAKKLLGTRDESVGRMSPFDRAVRMESDRPRSEKEFLEWVADGARAWEAEETERIGQVIGALRAELSRMKWDFPKQVLMIKSAAGDAGAAHTRLNAVILPERMVGSRRGVSQQLLAHELLHVLTRHNPELRRALYGAIGFRPCNDVELPEGLKARKITNPDAPWNDAYVRVSLDGQSMAAVPVLLSKEEKYDPQTGGGLFQYLTLRLLAIEQHGGQWRPKYRDAEPILLEVGQVSGFYEQVGRNTGYIIHPEEIVADNFAALVTGKTDVPSPEILDKMREVLSAAQPQSEETSEQRPPPAPE